MSDYNCISFERDIAFLLKKKSDEQPDFSCWHILEQAIEAVNIPQYVDKPDVFAALREFVYLPHTIKTSGNQAKVFKALNTLNDREIKILVGQLQCKVFDHNHNKIEVFIPSSFADYIIHRITIAFQSQFA